MQLCLAQKQESKDDLKCICKSNALQAKKGKEEMHFCCCLEMMEQH